LVHARKQVVIGLLASLFTCYSFIAEQQASLDLSAVRSRDHEKVTSHANTIFHIDKVGEQYKPLLLIISLIELLRVVPAEYHIAIITINSDCMVSRTWLPKLPKLNSLVTRACRLVTSTMQISPVLGLNTAAPHTELSTPDFSIPAYRVCKDSGAKRNPRRHISACYEPISKCAQKATGKQS
jgi:hypothetical protein